ncbi:hypothetical protein PIB30_036623 [Stylosanthes scabra]|uniref:Uncharacterized protein n=1 Tax=Stylosanthes scabra TaxID=79078 RepID=A0ABU6SEG1_9FABA|nr:hypothetical protein [Stylosanthes scabra]
MAAEGKLHHILRVDCFRATTWIRFGGIINKQRVNYPSISCDGDQTQDCKQLQHHVAIRSEGAMAGDRAIKKWVSRIHGMNGSRRFHRHSLFRIWNCRRFGSRNSFMNEADKDPCSCGVLAPRRRTALQSHPRNLQNK